MQSSVHRPPHRRTYGPPRRHAYKPYSAKLEAIENFKNKIVSAEYLDSISSHYGNLESHSAVNPAMIDLQPEVKWFMRPYLVNFLVQMHSSLKLKPQTLFLCWNIIDRYCARRIAFKQHYQLIGCTALWIASKYEDKKSRVPTVKELNTMCSNVYDDSMFREMEIHILSTLNWSIGHTTLEDILQLAVKFSDPDGKELLDKPIDLYRGNTPTVSAILAVSRYLCELTLYNRVYLTYPVSLVGVSCFLMACSILNMDVGSNYISHIYTLFEESMNATKKQAANSSSTSVGNNDNNIFSFAFRNEDDDGDEVDESQFQDEDYDSDADAENIEPKQHEHGPFVSGFNGMDSITRIREISLHLFKSLLDPSEVLIDKYSSLGVMTVVKRFIEDNDLYQIDLSLLRIPSSNSNGNDTDSNSNPKHSSASTTPTNINENPYSMELTNLLLSFTDASPFAQQQQQPRDLSFVSSSSDSSMGTPCDSPSNFSSFSSVSSATSYTFSLNSSEYALVDGGDLKDKPI